MKTSRQYDLENNEDLLEIIEGCKNNDEKIQQALFKKLYGKLMVVALRYCPDEYSAKDVLSDSFIKIFDKIGEYTLRGSFEGWARRIVVNTAIDSIRRKKKKSVINFDDVDYLEETSTEDKEFEFENSGDVKGIPVENLLEEIQNLSDSYRTVFNLYIFENYTHLEIAEELGISEGTSKSNLHKARNIIKDRIFILSQKMKKKEDKALELCSELDSDRF